MEVGFCITPFYLSKSESPCSKYRDICRDVTSSVTTPWELKCQCSWPQCEILCYNLATSLILRCSYHSHWSLFDYVRANCFCASLLRTQIHMLRHTSSARVLNWTIIGQMAIVAALLGLTTLDVRWPLLFFSETDFLYNYLHIVQKWTTNQCGKLKKISRFLSTGHGILPSCCSKAKLWSLNANLFFDEPHRLTEFT